jgi:hypothetical protein
MGKTITMSNISQLLTTTGMSGSDINKSINRIYGSPIGLLNYAENGGTLNIANSLLRTHYNSTQLNNIYINRDWLNTILKYGLKYDIKININGMFSGNVIQQSAFDQWYEMLDVSTGSGSNSHFFSEQHTGLDYTATGTNITSPGGVWQLVARDDHQAYYQLYGSDLVMRFQHLDTASVARMTVGTIYSGNSVLANYPTGNNGTGTGAHVHIDMTMSLPYNGTYQRQFVNPETLLPGNHLRYQYIYYDANQSPISSTATYFARYGVFDGRLTRYY